MDKTYDFSPSRKSAGRQPGSSSKLNGVEFSFFRASISCSSEPPGMSTTRSCLGTKGWMTCTLTPSICWNVSLVPFLERQQRRLQRRDVQVSLEAGGKGREIPRQARVQTLEKPEAALGERLLDGALVGTGDDGAVLGRSPAEGCREIEEDGLVKDLLDRHADLEAATDARGQPRGHEGVSAQVEEVVRDADLEAENIGKLLAQGGLDLVARRHGGLPRPAAAAAAQRHAAPLHVLRPARQLSTVDLTVGVQGHAALEHEHARRDHVARQHGPEASRKLVVSTAYLARRLVVADRRVVDGGVVVPRHDEADDLGLFRGGGVGAGGVLGSADDGGGVEDRTVGEDRLLDLGRLDSVAADLDLLVDAAGELDVAVGGPVPNPIAGPIRTDLPAGDGDVDKSVPVERRVRVPPREAVPGHDQLAYDADGHELLDGIHDVGARVAHGAADGHAAREAGVLVGDFVDGGHDGVLRRTVRVVDAAVPHEGLGLDGVSAVEPVAADEEQRQPAQHALLEQGRGQQGGLDVVLGECCCKGLAVKRREVVDTHEGSAVEEGRPDLPRRGVKGRVGHVGNTRGFRQLGADVALSHEPDDAAVLDHDPFRLARRSGGEHDVGDACGCGAGRGIACMAGIRGGGGVVV
ncbi:hypothetical protein ColKHC_04959 [Colletotrichum higginsianum]|nr:hypothetical protein ColKHC_04959 [Colletotrichum higginsianum]